MGILDGYFSFPVSFYGSVLLFDCLVVVFLYSLNVSQQLCCFVFNFSCQFNLILILDFKFMLSCDVVLYVVLQLVFYSIVILHVDTLLILILCSQWNVWQSLRFSILFSLIDSYCEYCIFFLFVKNKADATIVVSGK